MRKQPMANFFRETKKEYKQDISGNEKLAFLISDASEYLFNRSTHVHLAWLATGNHELGVQKRVLVRRDDGLGGVIIF